MAFASTSEVREGSDPTVPSIAIPDPSIPPEPTRGTTTTFPAPEIEMAAVETLGIDSIDSLRIGVVVGARSIGHEVRILSSDDTEFIALPLGSSDFSFDSTGRRLAFLRAGDEHTVLSIADLVSGEVFDTDVVDIDAYAWSGDEPGTLVWTTITSDNTVALSRGTVSDGAVTEIHTASLEPGTTLLGTNAAADWVRVPLGPSRAVSRISRLPRDGTTPRSVVSDLALVPPSGSVAVVADLELDGWDWLFGVFGAEIEPLAWAPWDAGVSGQLGVFDGTRIAFVGTSDEIDWVEVRTLDGGGFDRIGLPVPIVGVAWHGDTLLFTSTGSVLLHEPGTGSVVEIPVGLPLATASILSIDLEDSADA
jgi:hypothetical protein